MTLAKYSVGERVYVLKYDGSYFSGEVVAVKRTILGNYKYLLHYTVHDLDYDYRYKQFKWYREKSLFVWNT